jgi:hypothetical protein
VGCSLGAGWKESSWCDGCSCIILASYHGDFRRFLLRWIGRARHGSRTEPPCARSAASVSLTGIHDVREADCTTPERWLYQTRQEKSAALSTFALPRVNVRGHVTKSSVTLEQPSFQ